jgi:4-aminobutyrate aminotransferase-like enzyme
MVGVICSQYAYHGGTHATAAFTPCYLLPPPTPSPSLSSSLPSHIETVDFISLMQSQPPATSDDSPKECDAVVKAISALMDRNIIPAMLILDCGLTSDGVHPITSSLLRSIMYTCKKRDILFVADEVQVGFARAGGDVSIWGFETILKRTEREKQEGLYVPDIVTMGKPMANGFPMGAIVTQDHISELFSERQKYFNTFGGNPVAARACHAVLDVIEMEHLRDSARTTGAHLHFSFLSLQEEFPQWILSVRSIGLMLGVRVVDKSAASFLVMDLKERGFLVSVSGIKEDTLKIRPPLCMTRDEGVSLVNGLRESIQALVTSRSVSWRQPFGLPCFPFSLFVLSIKLIIPSLSVPFLLWMKSVLGYSKWWFFKFHSIKIRFSLLPWEIHANEQKKKFKKFNTLALDTRKFIQNKRGWHCQLSKKTPTNG